MVEDGECDRVDGPEVEPIPRQRGRQVVERDIAQPQGQCVRHAREVLGLVGGHDAHAHGASGLEVVVQGPGGVDRGGHREPGQRVVADGPRRRPAAHRRAGQDERASGGRGGVDALRDDGRG